MKSAKEIYNEVLNNTLFQQRIELNIAKINNLAEFVSDNKEQYIRQAMLKLKETMKDDYLFRSWVNSDFSYDLFNDNNFFVYLDDEILNYDNSIERSVFEKAFEQDLWRFLVPFCVSEHFYRSNQENKAEETPQNDNILPYLCGIMDCPMEFKQEIAKIIKEYWDKTNLKETSKLVEIYKALTKNNIIVDNQTQFFDYIKIDIGFILTRQAFQQALNRVKIKGYLLADVKAITTANK